MLFLNRYFIVICMSHIYIEPQTIGIDYRAYITIIIELSGNECSEWTT